MGTLAAIPSTTTTREGWISRGVPIPMTPIVRRNPIHVGIYPSAFLTGASLVVRRLTRGTTATVPQATAQRNRNAMSNCIRVRSTVLVGRLGSLPVISIW